MATDSTEKSVQFIAKLVQLTQDKKIRWEPAPATSEGSDGLSRAAFTTLIEGRQLRIQKVKREVPESAVNNLIFGQRNSPKISIVYSTVLEVLDDFGQVAFKFSGITGLKDLYDSASFSAAKVDDLMDSILKQ